VKKEPVEEPPPFLGTWKNVYIFVICYLACLIAAFYVFTRAYAP
jgi:ABC-type transport system involved in multi-copper enzyme maturation permease subunit